MPDRSIAVIGLGGMGSGMARAILDAGFPVTVFNRTRSKAELLTAAGARLAESASAAVQGTGTVLLSLADEAAVEEVLFGEVTGNLRTGAVVIDTSTVSPTFARNAAERLTALGARRVEACVVGNPQMAAHGALRVFAAGKKSDVDEVGAVLDAIAQQVRYLGPAGSASVLKLAFNLLLGVQTAGLGEAVAFVETMGLDRGLLLDALDNSGWRSPVLSFRAEFMRRRAYQPAGFRAGLMHKDLTLARDEALAHGVALPLADRTVDRFDEVLAAGRADDDAASVAELTQTR
ncbi:3-hydroxyisobutyrate dehydrogenase [Kibdelosporangium banguiense]|uniref:3-hydroxyisobutyrate dehydrogenase n=1 Tax=Kibdelosporangium banguiense TaxID=1365924 RepID=A0ABS4TSB9_9PSEU|nr:NAD(P)-dependent oxidoreductase [Kibdelosporangium banguiense]MBP2327286.1 3-hydroxyisobutyrate dehydrogenase [Kibdelosporangium banguiense]